MRRLPTFVRVLMDTNRQTGEYERLFPQIDRWVDEFMQRDLGPLSDAALWEEGKAVWHRRAMETMALHAAVTGASMSNFPMLENMVGSWMGNKALAYTLITGLTGVIQAELVPMLRAMAQKARTLGVAELILERDPKPALTQLRATPAAQPLLKMLDEFLRRHGHRAVLEAEWLYPRWIEAPELVVEMIAGYLRAGDAARPGDAGVGDQIRQRETATAQVEARLDPIRKSFFRETLKRVQRLVRLRDNGQHFLVKLIMPLCRIYRTLGERWAARGWLGQPEDFFFLVLPEIESTLAAGDPAAANFDLYRIVAERRKAYCQWFDVVAPEVLRADGTPFVAVYPVGADLVGADPRVGPENVLSGVAASAGTVRGTARLLANPREASRLQPGDILITRATDPGWTPAFSLISGLVLEVGGQLSHGAIVAREYGLPAVVNVLGATRRIRDGQTITVDGTAGRVSLEGD